MGIWPIYAIEHKAIPNGKLQVCISLREFKHEIFVAQSSLCRDKQFGKARHRIISILQKNIREITILILFINLYHMSRSCILQQWRGREHNDYPRAIMHFQFMKTEDETS